MLDEIRRRLIDSELSPVDLRIALDIIKAVEEKSKQNSTGRNV